MSLATAETKTRHHRFERVPKATLDKIEADLDATLRILGIMSKLLGHEALMREIAAQPGFHYAREMTIILAAFAQIFQKADPLGDFVQALFATADAEIAQEVNAEKYEPHTALAEFMRFVECVRRVNPALAERCYPHTTEVACLGRMHVPAHPEGATNAERETGNAEI